VNLLPFGNLLNFQFDPAHITQDNAGTHLSQQISHRLVIPSSLFLLSSGLVGCPLRTCPL
jgi:hypothetical protein